MEATSKSDSSGDTTPAPSAFDSVADRDEMRWDFLLLLGVGGGRIRQ
jgi:hypothetical protein